MEIRHLNCGTMYPFGLPLDDGKGGFFKRGHGVIHCLLIDTCDGLALVDTGWGRQDCIDPSPAVRQFMSIIRCPSDLNETAIMQVNSSGYKAADVKHIFLTHMHLDHAGGLSDFPQATVHIFAAELEAYLHPRTLMERRAYRPEHGSHCPVWQPHLLQGEKWFGLDCVSPIHVGETEFVMIPFIGHTRGHCAVALRLGDRWLLHCGDLYGYHPQVGPKRPYQYPGGKLMETIITTGFNMPRRHWIPLRRLLHTNGDQIQAICAHDAFEYKSCCEGSA